MKALIASICMGGLVALAQVLLRIGAGGISNSPIKLSNFLQIMLLIMKNPLIITGVFLFALSLLLWVIILSRVSLSSAYPVAMGIQYSAVMFLSYFLLKEGFSPGKAVGVLIILIGVLILSRYFS